MFAPYLPVFQLRRLAARAGLPLGATEERGEGATLLVDVAGFTSLTDRFAASGPEGAEELSEILNAYFGKMTDIIAQHGGDVVLFAGDAVLAVWPAHSNNLAHMTQLAAQCALHLTDQLHGYGAAPEVVLRHRAAIGAGQLSYLEVGGEDGRWHPLLAGDAIAQLGPTRKLARPGEIILAHEAWQQIARIARAEVLDDGEARLDELPETLPLPDPLAATGEGMDALLRAYVPEVVLQRLEAGHGEWLAEFRPVVVMFIHIAGVEYGTAGTLERLQNAMLAVQKPLEHYEGTVYQFLMDDKGTSLVAAFGLPHLAQEHEAVRAVNAATAIHRELSAMAVRASIGIASGRAFCGAYGSARRRQYTIVGPVINMASRLTHPAAGGILCDEATHRRAQDRIRFETLPPVLIKGRADPLPVFRPVGRVEDVARTAMNVLIGRERERELLHARIDRAAAGHGGVITISGEAGIGKSYVLSDVRAYAQSNGMHVLAGDGDALERSTTYFAWRGILARLLVDHPEPTVHELRAALLQRLSDDDTLLSWAPLVNAILPLGLEDTDVTRHMESEARIDSLRAIVAKLLDVASLARPMLLIIDDLHWLDSASLALIVGAAARARRLTLVLASRPADDSSPPALRRLMTWPEGEHLALEPLSSRDVAALVRHRLGVASVPDEVTRFIEERAEGHPFYSDELALALGEAGLIAVEDGVCRMVAEDLRTANFPDSVQAVVTSRIDRLDPVAQLALKTASVVGRVFPYDVLSSVYPVEQDRSRLLDALMTVEKADLAHIETPPPNLSYLFRHVITQDVAYNSLLFSHRRQLHERIAHWYEQRADANIATLYPLLAHHYDRAHVPANAVDYLEKAGIEALKAFSSQECAQFFQRVLQIAEEHPELADHHRRAEWERYLGDAYQHMTDYHRSKVHFYEALRLIGREMPSSRAGFARELASEVSRQSLHRAMPRRYVGSAQGVDARDLENAAVVYRGLAEIFFFQGDALAMIYCSLASLNCGERVRHYNTMSVGAGATAVILSLLGTRRLTDFYNQLGISYAKQGGSLTDLAYADGIQTTLVEVHRCEWKKAEEASLRGLAQLSRIGYRVRWEALHAGYGFTLQLTGRFEEAQHAFSEVYASARGSRLQNMIFARSGQLGTALMAGGEYPREWVGELEQLVGRSAPMTEATTSYGLIGQARLRAGDVAGAWDSLAIGMALMKRHTPASFYGLAGFANMAASLLEIWERRLLPDDSGIADRASEACEMLMSYSKLFRMGRPRAALCTAWRDALRGDNAKAIAGLFKGLASAQKYRMPYDEALLHAELARRLPASDERRGHHHAEAVAGFERLGAMHDLERIR